MLAHKLALDAFDDQPFKLFAIHCSLEDYRMAFLLNKHLNINLTRSRKDVDFLLRSAPVLFALYRFEDLQRYCCYYLISNKSRSQVRSGAIEGSLFGEEGFDIKDAHLFPELKNVDFFLKIEEDHNAVSEKELLEKIKGIPQIATAYLVGEEQIKTKQNLIFE